jgi:hypothetical protein
MQSMTTVRIATPAALLVAASAILFLSARDLRAQGEDPGCASAATEFQDACQKTVDVFSYLVPQLGTAVAGGNAALGQAGALGGFGHFSLGVRGTVVKGDVPKFSQITIHTGGASADTLPISAAVVPMASLDAGVGLFPGFPVGLTSVGSVDFLVDAFYLPSYSSNNVSIRPSHSLRVGFGGRIGLLKETSVIPGVGVTYLQHDLPTTSIIAMDGAGDSLRVQNMSLKTTSWRVVAGKNFFILGLAGGIGQDTYDAHTSIGAEVSGSTSGMTALAAPHERLTRSNYFADVTLHFALFRITGEIGGVSGGKVSTFNTFSGSKAGDGRLYGAIGMGVKI